LFFQDCRFFIRTIYKKNRRKKKNDHYQTYYFHKLFRQQAEKITHRNLAGKAVVWSHPNEYRGFRLWYYIGEETGLHTLYRKRWATTRRDMNMALILYSGPAAAGKTIGAFGAELFRKYGMSDPLSFGSLYSREEYLTMARLTGIDTLRNLQMYRMAKERVIDPRVPMPGFRK